MLLEILTIESSLVMYHQVELLKMLGVGDHIDLDDLAAPDCEAEHDEQPPTRGRDDPHGSVNEGHLREPGTRRKGERVLGHGRRPADLGWRASRDGRAIGADHDVRVEHRKQCLEIAAARSDKKGLDNFPLAGEIGLHDMARISLDPLQTFSYRSGKWFLSRQFGEVLDPFRAQAHNMSVAQPFGRLERMADPAENVCPDVIRYGHLVSRPKRGGTFLAGAWRSGTPPLAGDRRRFAIKRSTQKAGFSKNPGFANFARFWL
jgi:hypothetical protein